MAKPPENQLLPPSSANALTEALRARVAERDEREALLRQLRARRKLAEIEAEFDLLKFIQLYQPQYMEPTHLLPLCAAFDEAMQRPVIVLVEAPPRHFKTSVMMAGAARLLKYRAGASVAYCTYAADIAMRRSRNVRELAATAGVWVGELQKTAQKFDPSKSVAFWQTAQGGQFIAGGRQGQYIGEGFHLILYDDGLKNQKEAQSQTARDEAFETLKGTLFSRLEPGGSMIVAAQRWDDDDPIGRLKRWVAEDPDAPDVQVITLKAINDIVIRTDEKGNERIVGGTPLDARRFDLPELIKRASAMGDWFWRNYQQDTTPRGTRIFPELGRYEGSPMIEHAILLISCDPGIDEDKGKEKRKTAPDPSGIVVAWARLVKDEEDNPRIAIDVLLAEELWLEGPDLLDHLEMLQTERFPGARVLLEEVSAFRLLEQVAHRLNRNLDITSVTPRGSKELRSRPTAASAKKGFVRVPLEGSWVAGFCREVRAFTGKRGRKDNQVDALTQLHDQAELLLGLGQLGAEAGGRTMMSSSPW